MKFKLKQGFITQKKGNQTTLFNGEKSILFTLNDSASFMFEQIKKGLEEEKIIEMIVKKYKIGEVEAKKDFEELLKDLKNKRIIT